MTFYPERGIYSREEFSSSEGMFFSNDSLQGVTGGYVTLLSSKSGTSALIRNWKEITSWSFENNLYSEAYITGSFRLYTGNIRTSYVNKVSGYYGIENNYGAWYINTEYTPSGNSYSGQGTYGLAITSGTPYSGLYNFFAGGGDGILLEFDVASTLAYSGLDTLSGFSAGQINETGLAPLSGVVGHGVVVSNGSFWDYIEINPYGIRSLNHPEIAIPHDMRYPTRVRVGVRGSDLFLSTEDGKGVLGYNKFDTALGSSKPGLVLFGAPGKDGILESSYGILTDIYGTYGYTTWDNIKILTGSASIYSIDEIEQLYSKSYVSAYSPEFNPGIHINRFLSASIGYVPFKGGTTVVYAQYSGATGWVSSTSTTLTGGSSAVIDLSSIPTTTYPRANGGTDYLYNPIRFKIDQKSTNGDALPPAVSWIEVFADKENTKIDLTPDWKMSNASKQITASLVTGGFKKEDPVPDRWTSFLFNAPVLTGYAYGNAFTDEGLLQSTISVVGTGELFQAGPYGYAYSTYAVFPFVAISGSQAYDIYGQANIYNAFPNGLYDHLFRAISTGESNFYSGMTNGFIAEYMRIPQSYTGNVQVRYSKDSIFRPLSAAKRARLAAYAGTIPVDSDYTQGVYIAPITGVHDGTVGIEAYTLSGIVTGLVNIEFDLYMPYGDALSLTAISASTGSWYLRGSDFRSFSTVSVPFTADSDRSLTVKLVAASGSRGDIVQFNIDNLIINKTTHGYLNITGQYGYTHLSGTADTSVYSSDPARRASTIFGTSIYLNSYPQSTGTLIHCTGENNKGFRLRLNSSGYIYLEADHVSESWSTGSVGLYDTFYNESLVSETYVPLGKWTHIGFMHDVHNYEMFGARSNTGHPYASNFASSNKFVLTIDGYPVASKDLMTGWRRLRTGVLYEEFHPVFDPYLADANPSISYIPLSGNVKATIASGIDCQLSTFQLDRPPVGDVELDLSIAGARVTPPYFVPNTLYSPNNSTGNSLYFGGSNTGLGTDIFIGSIYNFSNPGHTNWDHGPLRNHLIFYNTVEKETGSPYSGEYHYATRFKSGYAIANYSSAYEKLQSSHSITYATSPDTIISRTYPGLSVGTYGFMGWIYPRTSGSFFTLYQYNNSTGCRAEYSIDSSGYVVLNKYNTTSNAVVYSHTGHTVSTGEWSFINLLLISTGHSLVPTSTGVLSSYIGSDSAISHSIVTGVDFGITYIAPTGSLGGSYHKIGGTADISMFNCAIPIYSTGVVPTTGNYGEVDKYGYYQTVLVDGTELDHTCSGYDSIQFTLPVSTGSSKKYISVPALNTYGHNPKLEGLVLYDNKPFKEIAGYDVKYDTSSIDAVYGTTLSPIRVGNQVPEAGVNIARISNPAFTVPSTISTIDLSDQNTNNLVTYKEGSYLIGRSNLTSSSSITGYQNINTSLYSGRVDITISGQIASADVEVSTIAIPSKESAYPAFYYYLVGRGSKAVKIFDAYPHTSGQFSEYSTGSSPDTYIANLERIKNSIKLKNRQGEVLPFDTYPYDVIVSQYTPNTLSNAVSEGVNIYLDGIGTSLTGDPLPDGCFSTILITNRKYIEGQSVFIHYDAFDIYSSGISANYKEIVNPQPIYRERYINESVGIGKFDLSMNTNNYYDLVLYGIASGFSGKF